MRCIFSGRISSIEFSIQTKQFHQQIYKNIWGKNKLWKAFILTVEFELLDEAIKIGCRPPNQKEDKGRVRVRCLVGEQEGFWIV